MPAIRSYFIEPTWEQFSALPKREVDHPLGCHRPHMPDRVVFENWDKSWLPILARHVSTWAHADHGLGMYAFMPAQRAATSNMLNNAIAVNCMHKLSTAQNVLLYDMELGERFSEDEFDETAHKTSG